MSIVRSPVRSVVRSPVRGVFGGADTQTDLQRLLALSPSLLIWPANGAGWQGTSGGTLAASGQPLGLGADLSQLGGKTLGEWLASVTPLALGAWTQIVGTGTISGSGANVTFAAAADNNYAVPTGVLVSGAVYEITVNVSAISAGSVRPRIGTGQTLGTQGSTGSVTYVVSAGATDFRLVAVGTTTATVSVTIKALPGNHLRAGTWASPSDAARASYVIQTDPALYNVSGQPELVTNGGFDSDTAWTKGAGWTITGGQAVATAVAGGQNLTNASTLTVGAYYVCTYTVTVTSGAVSPRFGNASGTARNTSGTYTEVGSPTVTGAFLFERRTSDFTGTIDNVSIKEIPASQYKYALSFGGVDDYYSLLNAISITESMTVVRAFKRATSTTDAVGLGDVSGTSPAEAFFAGASMFHGRLADTIANTVSGTVATTGAIVQSNVRNASQELTRINGAEPLARATAATAGGTLETFGRRSTASFNNGEISFLAVFPTELTGANLALVEQIAAATNGAVLA